MDIEDMSYSYVQARENNSKMVEKVKCGIGIKPATSAIIGSQQTPYIREDCIAEKDFVEALEMMMNFSKQERKEIGLAGREHIEKNYSIKQYAKNWDELFSKVHEECGSWATRKNYKTFEMRTY